ncbi:unnamed protein product [Blepharisma stoltei]|uniref:Uncharacterized protein n=1 Tax=Blepharisma stoltei TaxID=1481888 RepID=A0AAU9IPT0_9CILI|nr:unnamed protein product [Blepharisma stoltei]
MITKLYMDFLSQPSRAVLTVFLLGKIPVEIVETRAHRDTRKEEFLKIFEAGTVPAIQDDNISLYESHAIMEYLIDKYRPNDKLFPQNLIIRAKINSYLHWHHNNVRRGIHGFLEYSRFMPRVMGYQPSEDVVNFLREIKVKTLEFLDKKLEKNEFVAGTENMSIADISCFCEIVQLRFIGEDLSIYPHIIRWKKSIWALPEIQNSHQTFLKIMKNISQNSEILR